MRKVRTHLFVKISSSTATRTNRPPAAPRIRTTNLLILGGNSCHGSTEGGRRRRQRGSAPYFVNSLLIAASRARAIEQGIALSPAPGLGAAYQKWRGLAWRVLHGQRGHATLLPHRQTVPGADVPVGVGR